MPPLMVWGVALQDSLLEATKTAHPVTNPSLCIAVGSERDCFETLLHVRSSQEFLDLYVSVEEGSPEFE